MTLNPQNKGCDTHFKSEIAGDGPGQLAYDILATYIFKNLSFDLSNSRSLPCEGFKFKYSFKTN